MVELLEQVRSALGVQYRIERELGRGGTAIVFLAEDLKHERRVAIKVLRPDLAAALGHERFLREIKIAARLSHPHILPVHDSGDAEGFLYYVMPFVDGESLRDRLTREGALPIPDTLRLLHDVLDALEHAHRHGVVHRDMKPENVMLSGRHALVMDFGVAKALSVAVDVKELETGGVALGTPAYMAPEQAAADPSIDHRADIYSVGAMAYELLTGRPPFRDDTPQAVMAAHVTKEPAPVKQYRVATPPGLEYVVMRSLEKRPRERWQSAHEMLSQLGPEITPSGAYTPIPDTLEAVPLRQHRRSLRATVGLAFAAIAIAGLMWFAGTTRSAGGRPMIAVLPFENNGPSEDDYFANGVTSAITARLSTIEQLGVISRSSAQQYRGSGKSAQEVGRELNVEYVLEGTIQRERPADPTSRVRITPQLVRVSDDRQLWAGEYDEDLKEVFAVQSEIADRVARAMDVAVLEGEQSVLAQAPTENLEAYEAYLRGLDHLEGAAFGNANARRLAVEEFQEAVSLDPEFALAFADLSLAHMWLFHHFVDPSAERLAMARAAVDSALALDPDLPAAHLALGHYYYWRSDPDPATALDEFKLVAEREPNNAYARTLIGELHASRGEWDEALDNMALASELDPREADWAMAAGEYYALGRRYEEAERYLDRALALAPDFSEAHAAKAGLYLRWRGDTARAHQAITMMAREVTPGEVALALVQEAPSLVSDGVYDTLFQALTPASISGPLPFDYFFVKAEFYRLRNRPAESRAYFDSLLTELSRVLPLRDGDPAIYALLGRAYAGLGRIGEAREQAAILDSLVAESDDALRRTETQLHLAWIYALIGDAESAVDQLRELLAVPSPVSTASLRLEQFPIGLKRDPRFEALLENDT